MFVAHDCMGLSHAQKNKLASEKWSSQTPAVKTKYGETAKAMNSVKITELNDEQKSKLIKR